MQNAATRSTISRAARRVGSETRQQQTDRPLGHRPGKRLRRNSFGWTRTNQQRKKRCAAMPSRPAAHGKRAAGRSGSPASGRGAISQSFELLPVRDALGDAVNTKTARHAQLNRADTMRGQLTCQVTLQSGLLRQCVVRLVRPFIDYAAAGTGHREHLTRRPQSQHHNQPHRY